MSLESDSLAQRVEYVREHIARAASRVQRNPSEITVVAVSKTFPPEAIRQAYAAGLRHFGENRVQEWEGKQPRLADLDATWHLVGHLQTNKARRAARLFHTVDSVDSVELAAKLDAAVPPQAKFPVLLEVQLAHEESKSGIPSHNLEKIAEDVLKLPHLDLRGLMCIPPYFDDPEKVRPFFRRLSELRDDLNRRRHWSISELSMGMSHDFEIALEEGATQVRLGTVIFGERATR
jgi:PLP dependent protein